MNPDKFIYSAENSIGDSNSRNLLIKGDNLDILPALIKEYGGKIKCVYIDPPYNNGDSYHYYNDKISESNWLKEIRSVLNYLKILLTKDGSVWISIDDSEMAYLKMEADHIFGRENFAGTIIWHHRKTRENRALFSCNHEYILVYAKDIKSFKKSRNLLPVNDEFVKSKYKNPDNDPRGPWQSVSASVQAGHAVQSQFYTIISPSGVKYTPPKGRCWVYNEQRMKNEIAQGNIWFGKNGNNAPRIKKFLSSAKIGLTPQTLWSGDEYGTTDSAKKHLLNMFDHQQKVFETPKPEELIMQILQIATNEGDIVMDCYLGSGTTAAAAHKFKRHYIGIEKGSQINELAVIRLKNVINGEKGGISEATEWKGGGNFAFFDFNENKIIQKESEDRIKIPSEKKRTYHQLDLFSLLEEYGENSIFENNVVCDKLFEEYTSDKNSLLEGADRNVLISLVKKDNEDMFINKSATIYYAGHRFPSSVALNKLCYFIPYLKGKGIRDLYVINIARVGNRKEGQLGEDKADLRLVFEIKYVKQLFEDYVPTTLNIWRTYTDTTIKKLLYTVNNYGLLRDIQKIGS